MRILPLTTIVLLVGAGYALAQGTPNSPNTMSSGRPVHAAEGCQLDPAPGP
jgi:hypothetical protein